MSRIAVVTLQNANLEGAGHCHGSPSELYTMSCEIKRAHPKDTSAGFVGKVVAPRATRPELRAPHNVQHPLAHAAELYSSTLERNSSISLLLDQ